MTASLHHHVRRAGTCHQQGQQRCAAMTLVVVCTEDMAVYQVFAGTAHSGRPVVISVWNKKTGAGIQN